MSSSAIFILFFIVLSFCIIALLSVLSQKNNTVPEVAPITAMNRQTIEEAKTKYRDFLHYISEKKIELLKNVCTPNLLNNFNITEISATKILCILSSNVLQLNKNNMEIQFISRGINTELFINKCIFTKTSKSFLLDKIE